MVLVPAAACELEAPWSGSSRACRSRARRRAYNARWANEAVRALNEISGHGDIFPPGLSPSLGQRRGLDRIRTMYSSIGAPPPISAAEAHAELCGHRPGYDEVASARCSFRRERVSLPARDGFVCQPGEVLTGADLEAWKMVPRGRGSMPNISASS